LVKFSRKNADPRTVTTIRGRMTGARLAAAAAVPVALLASTVLVVQASRAASSASLESADSAWRSGHVTIATDASSSALFNVSKIFPGDTGERCLRVDYTGNVPATVRLWAQASGTLAGALQLSVEEGTGGGAADCLGFTRSATLFGPGALLSLATAHHDGATGLSSWAPPGAQSRTYRLTWSLAAGNSAQGQSASATFNWQARQR
jgi:hypothetical protein